MNSVKAELRAKVSDDLHAWYEDLSIREELPMTAIVRRALRDYQRHIESIEEAKKTPRPPIDLRTRRK